MSEHVVEMVPVSLGYGLELNQFVKASKCEYNVMVSVTLSPY